MKPWCTEKPIEVEWLGFDIDNPKNKKKIPNRVTCPLCGRRFKPRVRTCYNKNCWHAYVPPHKQKNTIKALGLRRINHSVVHTATPQILGMVNKVKHLVKTEELN